MVAARLRRQLRNPRVQALLVGLIATLGFACLASPSLWQTHTPYNHFALLAEAWNLGQLHLPGAPPAYAAGNDFAVFEGKWYVVFPAFPAVVVWPWVALLGGAEHFADGAFFLLLAGVAPTGLCLLLHRARDATRIGLSDRSIIAWSLLYAFGSIYGFVAVQGTVWFAAHVVASAATVFFLWASIDARRPVTAGLCLGMAMATRTHLAAIGLFYVLEVLRSNLRDPRAPVEARASLRRQLIGFGLPIVVTLGILALHNQARFGSPFEFGYRYLDIAWQTRIARWGLFSYHYLARNLGILLTSLPYWNSATADPPWQINGHGLALWVTSPFYLWLLWPRQKTALHRALYWTLPFVMLPSLLYQNSGWLQFGPRFSLDYAPLLFVLLALGGFAWSRWLKAACAVAIVVNLFGALTFGRAEWRRYYYVERTQRVIYQPD